MKNFRWLGIVFLVVVFTAAVAGNYGCDSCGVAKTPVEKIIAKDAANALIVTSPATTLTRFKTFMKKFEGSMLGGLSQSQGDLFKSKFGFDPFDAAGWKSAGLDAGKSLAMTLEPLSKGTPPREAVILMIGVSDNTLFEKTIKRLAKQYERAETYKETTYKGTKITTIVRKAPEEEAPLFTYAFFEGYAVMADPENGPEGIQKIIDRKTKDGLDTLPSYTKLSGKVIQSPDVKFFVNENTPVDRLPTPTSFKELLVIKTLQENFKGAIAAAAIGSSSLEAEIFASLSEESGKNLQAYMSGNQKMQEAIFKTVGNEALAVFKLSVDLKRLYEKVKKDAPVELEQLSGAMLGKLKGVVEPGLEAKIIQLLSGDAAWVMYPVKYKQPIELFTAIKNQGLFPALIDNEYIVSISDPISASPVTVELETGLKNSKYIISDKMSGPYKIKTAKINDGKSISWVLKDNVFIITEGDRIDQELAIAGGASGSLGSTMSGELKTQMLAKDAQILYLNFSNLAKAVDDFQKSSEQGGLPQQLFLNSVIDILSRFKDGAVFAKTSADGIKLELILNTVKK